MDLRGGPPLKQQQDFEIQGLCVPSTPAKTIETRRPLEFSPSYSQRSQPSEGCCWLDSAEGVSTVIQDATPPQGHQLHNGSYSTSGICDFLRVLTGSQPAEDAFACQATSSGSFMPQEPTTSCGNVRLMDPWSQNLCGNGFDASSDAGVSEILSLAPFCVPNGHGQEMPASQNNLLLHGNVLLTESFCNISSSSNCSIWPGQKVQYEPTDDCHPNLNSFPEITISSAETLTVPNSLTPMATEKFSQRIQDKQPSLKVIDLVDEGTREDNLQRKGSCSSHMALDKPANASFSSPMDSLQHSSFKNPECANNMAVLPHEFSDQLVGNEMSITERENDTIDLNDASKQKPKRRKHRPKVIKEGKPSRTPKLVTPMPKTPKSTGDKQRASGKRKYVRRKDTALSPETTLNGLRNIVELESRNQAKPVRRNLKFDLEEAQTIDKHSLLMSYFMQRLENHAQEACTDGSLTSPRLKETVDSTELQGPVVENSLAGIVFTLNNSKTQPQNEYLKILQTPLTSMGNHNVRASNEGINSNSISDAAIKGTKRAHCGTFNARAASKRNLMHSHYVANCASESHDAGKQGSCFSDSHKRMKKQNGYRGATPDPSFELIYTPSTGWKYIQASNNSQDFTFSNAQAFKAQEKLQISCEKADDYIHSHHLLGNDLTSFSRFIDSNMNSSPFKLCMKKNMGISQPSTPDKPSGYSNSQESKNRGMLVQLEKSDVNKPVKTKGRRGRKKREENPLVNPLPSSIIVGDSPKQTSPVITSTISRYLHEENLLLEVNSVNCQDTSNYNVSTNIILSSGPLAPYMNPVDDIVQKLSHLSINRDHEVAISHAPSALVPYVGDGGMMVPYKDLAKRRRPRSKVDLDPETNRVWKLLMGKECGEDGANGDKEKWWEEERGVFQGRVDSFIARMHLVQGDRRFSQWKGSVVDSVIGVFLTQNVSDHLSSSAFMALAARFPLQLRGNSRSSNAEKLSTTTENHSFCCQGSLEVTAAENEGKEENSSSNETLGIGIIGSSSVGYFKEKTMELHDSEASFCHGSPNIESGTEVGATRSVSSVEVEDRRLEEVVSSQNFVVPLQDSMGCQVHSVDHIRSNLFVNIEAEDLSTGSVNNGLAGSSFTNLMQIAESSKFQKLFSPGVGRILTTESSSVYSQMTPDIGSNLPALNQLDNFEGTCQSHKTDSTPQHAQFSLLGMLPGSHLCHFLNPSNLTSMENNANALKEDIRSNLPSTTRETTSGAKIEVLYHESTESKPENLAELGSLNKLLSTSRTACTIDSYLLIGTQSMQNVTFSETELGTGQYSFSPKNLAERTNVSSNSENSHECSILQPQDKARFRQKDEHSISKEESSKDAFRVQDQMVNSTNSKIISASEKKLQNRLDMAETFESNMKYGAYNFQKVSSETPKEGVRVRRKRAETEKKTYDWNSLRKEVYHNKHTKERSSDTMDSLDWEAVRCAPVSEIAETIRERGMNNVLAERIKEFLNRLVREHGSIDLEWLRDIPPDKSKDYLLSIRGLGLKSTECVRLLTLHHLAFPVDTNVGRICVRLGWVPLQPLPESLQLHLLELYPVLETIQKYLWPRLCKLDQRTLYELHYQMITFGKVFCTKSKPNCNACPMRGECRHFASAFASARLALPAPEDKSIVCSTYPIASENDTAFSSTRSIPQIECSSLSQERRVQKNCEPIIEEPATPEPECPDALESAIEDAFFEDPDEIPMIKLNFEKFTQNLQNFMQEKMELQDGDMSKALVALTPEAASIPMPKLKNVSRLRTEHQVYEIPDSHPLLEGLDTREPDDPCPYLLAIWTPGETAQSTELPEVCCNAEGTSQLCDRSTCFACNSTRESQAHKVRGTLLIPCRTAMKGSFPLNGTYFQVNEVFADHHSSRNPIDVPRDWIWNLPRRMVCFGTSIPTIFRGLSTEGIQQCFWRGFVCVRGFDRVTRAPKPLFARLHFPASKAPKSRKGAALLQGQKNWPKSPQTKLESIILQE